MGVGVPHQLEDVVGREGPDAGELPQPVPDVPPRVAASTVRVRSEVPGGIERSLRDVPGESPDVRRPVSDPAALSENAGTHREDLGRGRKGPVAADVPAEPGVHLDGPAPCHVAVRDGLDDILEERRGSVQPTEPAFLRFGADRVEGFQARVQAQHAIDLRRQLVQAIVVIFVGVGVVPVGDHRGIIIIIIIIIIAAAIVAAVVDRHQDGSSGRVLSDRDPDRPRGPGFGGFVFVAWRGTGGLIPGQGAHQVPLIVAGTPSDATVRSDRGSVFVVRRTRIPGNPPVGSKTKIPVAADRLR